MRIANAITRLDFARNAIVTMQISEKYGGTGRPALNQCYEQAFMVEMLQQGYPA